MWNAGSKSRKIGSILENVLEAGVLPEQAWRNADTEVAQR